MHLVGSSSKFVVYDNVMPENEWASVWKYVETENYSFPHIGKWEKVWRLTDAMPMAGPCFDHSKRPFHNALDLVHFYVTKTAERHPEIVGTEWNEIHFRSYLYPRGTKLSWHNDNGYEAAAIFYSHPKWGASWGGELMIAETPPETEQIMSLDRSSEDRLINSIAMGQFIGAKPNRLVITTKNVWHSINRVDIDAGDNIRNTIVAFFKKV